jgi:hypothetical protein
MKQIKALILALALLAPQPAHAAWYDNIWNWVVEQKNVALCLVGIAAACAVTYQLTRCDDRRTIYGIEYLMCPGVDLEKADLHGTKENMTQLQNANLKRANLVGANLSRADLTRANLLHANLTGAILGGAILKNANLKGATLVRVNLNDADLSGANLSGADLTGASIAGTKFAGAYGTVMRNKTWIDIQTLQK